MLRYFACFALILMVFSPALFASADDAIVVGTSGMYPPFEYMEAGELKGFDIDLANVIAEHMGKKIVFKDMQFASLFPALNSNNVDFIIATLSITEERKKNFDFSFDYYKSSISAVFLSDQSISSKQDLVGKRISSQLGTTISLWARTNVPGVDLVEFDDGSGSIEALKAGHVSIALVDSLQAGEFVANNSNLSTIVLGELGSGYAIAFKKGSPLVSEVNAILSLIHENGVLASLEKKWLVKSNDAL